MKITHDGEYFKLTAKWSEITAACGGLTQEDYRQGFLHLLAVAGQNLDEHPHGVDLIGNMIPGYDVEFALPDPIRKDLTALYTEAMAAGKELTLRKLARVFDPNGEFIEVPEDWHGKGPGA